MPIKTILTIILVSSLLAAAMTASPSENTILWQTAPNPPELVTFATPDGGLVYANLYGKGERGVVLAHGGRFNKESWEQQAQTLTKSGFQVLAIDFRGYGQSKASGQADQLSAPLHLDVLAAVRFLRQRGAKTVSVIGGSMGGGAGADAMIAAAPGEIECLIVLGGVAGEAPPEKLKGRKLFILTRDDANADGPRLPGALKSYEAVPQPKELILLEGSAHAQFLFQSEHRERVMREILRFLPAGKPK